MPNSPWQCTRLAIVCVLVTIFAVQPNLVAQVHVVSPGDLQQAAVAASRARQQNLDTLNAFLSTPQAEKALRSAHLQPTQVKSAVSSLSDEELAQLAPRAQQAQADFVAGALSNRDLLWIIVAIAALVLIIVAVRH